MNAINTNLEKVQFILQSNNYTPISLPEFAGANGYKWSQNRDFLALAEIYTRERFSFQRRKIVQTLVLNYHVFSQKILPNIEETHRYFTILAKNKSIIRQEPVCAYLLQIQPATINELEDWMIDFDISFFGKE